MSANKPSKKKTKKSAKKSASTAKNLPETSQQAFDLEILNSSHPEIKKLKREYPTSIHGNKFWGSSFLLMDYFRKNPLSSSDRVLELGCGWALASIYLNNKFGCHVTCIDADEDVFPYANLHASINAAEISTVKQRFENISKAQLADYDVIIAADVCFWDELSEIHLNLIRRALQVGIKKIIYADPERAPFTELAQRAGQKLKQDNVHILCEDARVKSLKASGKLLRIEQD